MEIADIRGGKPHTGIDLGMPENTILRSVKEGFVENILHNNKIGNGVIIKGTDGKQYIYGHLNKIKVEPGQHLFAGQEIGLSGNTGNSTGSHLHFAVKDHGQFIDPTHLGENVAAMAGDNSNWFVDKWNHLGDFVIEKETNILWKPFVNMLRDFCLFLWDWFIHNLPDIMGYSAVLTGICIILGAMFGKGGMLKPIAIYAGGLIVSVCILMSK
jgi:hypothetical protein